MKTFLYLLAGSLLSVAMVTSGCMKMPKAEPSDSTDGTTDPDDPQNPPPSFLYPFGFESQSVSAEIMLDFESAPDLSTLQIEIPPLKYDKSLLVMLTQDDCKQAAFSTTWAAINGRPLSDTYFYCANQMRAGDLPPGSYGFGKTLGSTDGTGREVRFSFTTTVSPEYKYMADTAAVRKGYTGDYYRFFMKRCLTWGDVGEMLNYGVSIALHNVETAEKNNPDSILAHYPLAQQSVLTQLAGRGCKLLAEPDGNKNYVTAAQSYDPIRFVLLQNSGNSAVEVTRIVPYALDQDLVKANILRDFMEPNALMTQIETQMKQPVESREAINIGVHGTDRKWSEFLLWLNNTYGKEGSDCLWMPSPEEYLEYNYLRCHATITPRIEENRLIVKVDMPGLLYSYYPSLTLIIRGVDPAQCQTVDAGSSVTGLSWSGVHEDLDLMVNFDCRRALVELATHFVELYEDTASAANKADALYFVAMLKDSPQKTALQERIK